MEDIAWEFSQIFNPNFFRLKNKNKKKLIRENTKAKKGPLAKYYGDFSFSTHSQALPVNR